MKTRPPLTILLADSDADVRHVVRQALQTEGHYVLDADSARSALRLARADRPDMIILDATLHDMGGFELCTRLRALPFVTDVPILFLGRQHSANHVAQALDCGGDDYLRKPFIMSELHARVRALTRWTQRRRVKARATLHLELNTTTVRVNNRRVSLTPTEFNLLVHLCDNPSTHHTAHSLLESLWRYPPGGGDTALVRNHIRNLRLKIEDDPDHPQIITSQHGRGYTINARVAKNA